MGKAVFLDRDGTINIDKKYLYKIEEFEFLPGVLNGLRWFKEAGYLLVIITNQSGEIRKSRSRNRCCISLSAFARCTN